jgi:repressor LexA
MNSTTQRQRAICRFIRHYSQEHGWPPSRREIGQALRMESLGHVEYWLRVLAQQDYLRLTPHVSRGLTLTAAGIALAESKITAPPESGRGQG